VLIGDAKINELKTSMENQAERMKKLEAGSEKSESLALVLEAKKDLDAK